MNPLKSPSIPDYPAETLAQVKATFGDNVNPGDAVASLIQGLQKKYGLLGYKKATPEDQKRWTELIDLQVYLDQGPDYTAEADNDPLPLIERLAAEGFITNEQAETLNAQFNERVRKIVGHELSPAQIAAFREMLREFDPTVIITAQYNNDKFA